MTRDEVIAILRAHETELRALGAESIVLFGSTARNEATPLSDVDIAVKLEPALAGFRSVGKLDAIARLLTGLLRRRVDVIAYPGHPGPVSAAISRDECLAF